MLPLQGELRSLVGELRSRMPRGAAKKEKKRHPKRRSKKAVSRRQPRTSSLVLQGLGGRAISISRGSPTIQRKWSQLHIRTQGPPWGARATFGQSFKCLAPIAGTHKVPVLRVTEDLLSKTQLLSLQKASKSIYLFRLP